MIIIPDVHGRSYWKEAVTKRKSGDDLVFLGDYLDPYHYEFDPIVGEYITEKGAIENFKEIIEYAKKNPNTILLLGNHDAEYFIGTPGSRMDFEHEAEIRELFENNLDLFRLGYYKDVDNITVTFSHSGIVRSWVNGVMPGEEDIKKVIDNLNSLLRQGNFQELRKMLSHVSYARGGWCSYGSVIWSDVREMPDFEWLGVHQIFGHTQQPEFPVFGGSYSMLDCRRAFKLDGKQLSLLFPEYVQEPASFKRSLSYE